MTDGPTEATDLSLTEANRELVQSFVEDVLIKRRLEKLAHYVDNERYVQHNPSISDGLSALRSALNATSGERNATEYDRNHRMLAEGSFVLSVSEGSLDGIHSSFYDLFRVAKGKIAEHWDTIEAIPARSEWKNDNGKF